MISTTSIDHRALYRLPWTLPDNAISWLEPTSECNLACDGCYRENVAGSHKPLEEIRKEIDAFRRLRNSDGISIAGGDPLMHPEIVEIVRSIHEMGMKPIVNTNGSRLTRELLGELKKAGVYGFTFHVDSKQGRPGWKGKNEIELNNLRLELATMLHEQGGICCSFNSTVYEDTLEHVPEMVAWAGKHIDIVHTMVFILYRAAVPQIPFDWYAGAEKINMNALVYSEAGNRRVDMKSPEVVAEIRKRFPDFTPCAYLNGTEKADSYKWLLSARIGTTEQSYGYVGRKYMEIMQACHHIGTGRYLAYASPGMTSMGRTMLLFAPLDAGVRAIAKRWAGSLFSNPLRFFRKMHLQSIMIIQPVDFMENGAQNMCDGCPDMTMWNGELVWSCRMEELKHFGGWVRTVPRESTTIAPSGSPTQ